MVDQEREVPSGVGRWFIWLIASLIVYSVLSGWILPGHSSSLAPEGLSKAQLGVRHIVFTTAFFLMFSSVPTTIALLVGKAIPANRSRPIGNYLNGSLIATWCIALFMLYGSWYGQQAVDDYRKNYIVSAAADSSFAPVACPPRLINSVRTGLNGVGKVLEDYYCFSSSLPIVESVAILDKVRPANESRRDWGVGPNESFMDQYEYFGDKAVSWTLLPKIGFLEEIYQGALPKELETLVFVALSS